MKVDGRVYRAIWPTPDGAAIEVIDQTLLPHRFSTRRIEDLDGAIEAIKTIVARGAPLIGATAAYGLALALRRSGRDDALERAYRALLASRPTAVNLRNALNDVSAVVARLAVEKRAEAAWARAGAHGRLVRRGRRLQPAHRRGRLAPDRSDPPPAPARGQHPDPLQRRLAGDGRLGRRDGADLHGPRPRRAGARLRRRDVAAQSRRGADRVRTRPARRAAHRRRRQRRRPSHAARTRRSGDRGRGSDHHARRPRQQDRRLSQGSRGARPPRAVLRRGGAHFDRLDDPRRPRRNRDRGARPRRGDAYRGAPRRRTACARGDRRRPAPRRPIRPST